MKISLRIATLIIMVCMAVGTSVPHVTAQETETSALKIESVNVENLPEVSVLVRGKNLDGALAEYPLSILEDGVDQELQARNSVEKGLQIGLVIDPALDLTSVGNSGDAVQFEIANGASSLIQSGILSVRTDWLAAFAISNRSQTFEQLDEEWQRDHQAIVNSLYQYVPVAVTIQPSLFDAVEGVMTAVQNAPLADDLQRNIVLFSDGLSLLDSGATNQIILNAQAQDISIQVVLLGDGNTQTRSNLRSIAAATDGDSVTYEDAASLNTLWQQLDEDTKLDELVYRLGQASPQQISVVASPVNGVSLIGTEEFPEISLEPVDIEILSPSRNETIERVGDSLESGIADLIPSRLSVALNFAWPDDVEREIKSVTYRLNGSAVLQDAGLFTAYELPIEDLDEGEYSLEVTAIDEYGLSSSAEPVAFDVAVNLPSSSAGSSGEGQLVTASNSESIISTETTQSEVVQEDASNQGMNILGLQLPETIDIFGVTFLVNGITLLIALFPIIFLLALFLYWLTQRNEQPAEPDYGYYEYDNNGYFYRFEPSSDEDNMQMTQPQVSIIEPEEDLTMPVKLPSFYTNAAAYLVYVSGGEHLPKKIAIETNQPVRIGRKKSFCDQILDDQRVSRLHAVITYEGGNFYVKDEGSSGGTFVNRRKLGPTDKQLLKGNDIVNFNEVEYRIEVSEPDSTVDSQGEPEFAQRSSDAESVVS